MPYVSPSSRLTGDLITVAIWNQDVVTNVKANPAELVTTAGDIVYATAANALARLALGASGFVLTADGAGGLAWQAAAVQSRAINALIGSDF